MTRREFAVLDAVNIASTRYRRPGHDYEATAAQIAAVLGTDERLAEHGFALTVREVAGTLGSMAMGHPRRREPLVERVDDERRWRLSDAGIRVLSA